MGFLAHIWCRYTIAPPSARKLYTHEHIPSRPLNLSIAQIKIGNPKKKKKKKELLVG